MKTDWLDGDHHEHSEPDPGRSLPYNSRSLGLDAPCDVNGLLLTYHTSWMDSVCQQSLGKQPSML